VSDPRRMRSDGETKINMVKYCVGCSVGLIPAGFAQSADEIMTKRQTTAKCDAPLFFRCGRHDWMRPQGDTTLVKRTENAFRAKSAHISRTGGRRQCVDAVVIIRCLLG
jgi:hypothetical protein